MARHFQGSISKPFSKIAQLGSPLHDDALLPVVWHDSQQTLTRVAGRVLQSMIESRKDLQVVADFRNKLRTAEDLVSKLGFSLREIQGSGRKRSSTGKNTSKKNSAQTERFENSNVVQFTRFETPSEDRCV